MTYLPPSPIAPLPGGKSLNTRKQYQLQGWNAAIAGFRADQVPYYATSTAWECWLRGFRSAEPDAGFELTPAALAYLAQEGAGA